MSIRKQFKTDPKIELAGVEVDFGDAVFTVRRAGGANKAYKVALAKAIRPHRHAIESESITDTVLMPVLIRCFCEHVLLNAQVRRSDGSLVQGYEGLGGVDDTTVPLTVDNGVAYFTELPDVYERLQKDASRPALFLEDLEAAAKNL
jgi:hypothetical protein